MQRLKDGLPSALRTHMATIRNTRSSEAAASVFSQIQQSEQGIIGTGDTRSRCERMREAEEDIGGFRVDAGDCASNSSSKSTSDRCTV